MKMDMNFKRLVIFLTIVSMSVWVGYRIREIRKEGIRTVHNIVRIHAENGIPQEYITVNKTTDFLYEPIYVENGRALVSLGRINKFKIGQKIKDKNITITYVSNNIDLDTGMFVVRLSHKITGNVFVESQYTGFFLPLDAEVPSHAKIIAKDNERVVVSGLNDGDKVVVR